MVFKMKDSTVIFGNYYKSWWQLWRRTCEKFNKFQQRFLARSNVNFCVIKDDFTLRLKWIAGLEKDVLRGFRWWNYLKNGSRTNQLEFYVYFRISEIICRTKVVFIFPRFSVLTSSFYNLQLIFSKSCPSENSSEWITTLFMLAAFKKK